jgi:SAM-dependent methyltransferase
MSFKRSFSERFPRSSNYNPEWLSASSSGGANPLWLTEWLSTVLDLKPGMRVLDLGCGRAASSIFLQREFGVVVWATDLWFSAAENFQRISDAGAGDAVFPVHADARALPFATEFFDAVVSIDSFPYYGTDDLYLAYLARYLKPGGVLAIAGAGLTQAIRGPVPGHLCQWWEPSLWCLHSSSWWRRHWERTGIVEVKVADSMPDGWLAWLEWQRALYPDNHIEIAALEADHGDYLGYVRVVGRRCHQVHLEDPIVSFPAQYTKKPLLRAQDERD